MWYKIKKMQFKIIHINLLNELIFSYFLIFLLLKMENFKNTNLKEGDEYIFGVSKINKSQINFESK